MRTSARSGASVTDSPSDAATEATPEESADQDPAAEAPEPTELESFAAEVAAQVGASAWSADHGTAKLTVDRAGWHQAVAAARDEAGLDFFSWLSAIDWS